MRKTPVPSPERWRPAAIRPVSYPRDVRLLLIINTYATNYDLDRRRAVEAALGAAGKLEVEETHRHGHGLPIAQGAVNRGADAIVVWGGDGTVNEAANALAGTSVPLGIIPGGSTNVTARTLGIPNDVSRATGFLLDSIESNRTRRIGLGRAGERYFTFSSGIGFDAAIVREVERRSMLKRTIGPSVYIAAALAMARRGFDRMKPTVRFHYDDGSTSPDLVLAIVSNSSPYTFLGNRPMVISPGVDHATPLEVFGLKKLPFPRTMAVALAAFVKPSWIDATSLVHRHRFVSAEAEGLPEFEMHVDAEYRGIRRSTWFHWEPESLYVYV